MNKSVFALAVALMGMNAALAGEPDVAQMPELQRESVAAPVDEVKPVEAHVASVSVQTGLALTEEKPLTFTGVHFYTKSSRLRSAALAMLDDVVEFARLYPEAKLQIAGHTDCRAGRSKKAYNRRLSLRRAAAFKAALIEKGVAAERISVEGFGFEQPVADNNTETGRAKNRRVEIRSAIRPESAR